MQRVINVTSSPSLSMESTSSCESPNVRTAKMAPEGYQVLREAFNQGMQMPTREEKQALLDQINALPGCGHYSRKSIDTWFTQKRAAARHYAQKAVNSSGKRLILSKEGSAILRNAFEQGIRNPSDEQKDRLLQRINALPGCGHYGKKDLGQWFKGYRKTDRSKARAATSFSTTSLSPIETLFTSSDQETLQTLFSNAPNPSQDLVLVWADLLEARLEDVELWVSTKQRALEHQSMSTSSLSQHSAPASQFSYPHLSISTVSAREPQGWQPSDVDMDDTDLDEDLKCQDSDRCDSPHIRDLRTSSSRASLTSKSPLEFSPSALACPPTPNLVRLPILTDEEITDSKVADPANFHSLFASSMNHLLGPTN